MVVLEKLKDMLSVQLGADIDIITANTEIVNDLGADSLDVAELLMGVEDEFGLLLTEESVVDIQTVGELAAVIDKGLEAL